VRWRGRDWLDLFEIEKLTDGGHGHACYIKDGVAITVQVGPAHMGKDSRQHGQHNCGGELRGLHEVCRVTWR